jgi:hypothetical protein
MQRPKQQALAFLLGAVLVGSVVGFSADRMFRREDTSVAAKRTAMYDDLDLQPAQRAAMDSLFDARNCKYDSIFNAIRPALESVKADTRAHTNAILSDAQHAKLESRWKDHDAKDEAERKRIQSHCHN